MSTILLRSLLERSVESPELPILLRCDAFAQLQTVNYARFIREIRSFAGFFVSHGLQAQELVAIIARRNSIWLAADCAIGALGAGSVCIDPQVTPIEMIESVDFCRSRFCVLESEATLQILQAMRTKLPLLQHVLVLDPAQNWNADMIPGIEIHSMADCFAFDSFRLEELVSQEDYSAAIVPSPQDDGEQRSVMWTDQALHLQADHIGRKIAAPAGSIALITLKPADPHFRILVQAALLAGWVQCYGDDHDLANQIRLCGAKLLFAPERSLEELGRGILGPDKGQFGLRLGIGFNGTLYKLESKLNEAGSPLRLVVHGLRIVINLVAIRKRRLTQLGDLRLVLCRPNQLAWSVRELLAVSGLRVQAVYCSPEAGIFAAGHPRFPVDQLSAMPDFEFEVRDQGGMALANTERGSLYLRGPHIMKGFLRQPLKSRDAIDRQSWLATGLQASLDGTGRIRVYGQTIAMLRLSDGNLVDPLILASHLRSSWLITDAWAIRGRDGILELRITASIAGICRRLHHLPMDGFTEENLLLPKVQGLFRHELRGLLSGRNNLPHINTWRFELRLPG